MSGISIGKALDKAYAEYWEGGKNERVVFHHVQSISKKWRYDKPINEITTSTIDDYITELKQDGLKNSTINRRLSVLSKTIQWTHQHDLLTKLPYIPHLSEKGLGRIEWFTKEEELAILSLLTDMGQDYIYDYAIVSVDTGMKAREVIKFDNTLVELPQKWKDDSSTHGIYIPDRKNGEPALIPITKRIEDILRVRSFDDHISKCKKYVKAWNKVRDELNLRSKCWHTWRHTTATRLRQKGCDIANIQAFMGHKSITTTLKYAKWDTELLVSSAGLLEDYQ